MFSKLSRLGGNVLSLALNVAMYINVAIIEIPTPVARK